MDYLKTLFAFVLSIILYAHPSLGALEKYNIDPSSITVSGFASGGSMAQQFHYAHSTIIKGAGVFASGPFLCGYGGLDDAVICAETPNLQIVSALIAEADFLSITGQIDPLRNIGGSKVFIYHGYGDIVVQPGASLNTEEMYKYFGADIKPMYLPNAGHGQPVDGNGYGLSCNSSHPDNGFVNECGYNGAYEMLNHLYGGNLTRPEKEYVAAAELIEFSQNEFFLLPVLEHSMAPTGFIYVPTACQNKTMACKLHIAFHGCNMQSQVNGDRYPKNTHYMEVAELNNIIVLFPQALGTVLNVNGCYDWYGYTTVLYPTKAGIQISGVNRMLSRIVSG